MNVCLAGRLQFSDAFSITYNGLLEGKLSLKGIALWINMGLEKAASGNMDGALSNWDSAIELAGGGFDEKLVKAIEAGYITTNNSEFVASPNGPEIEVLPIENDHGFLNPGFPAIEDWEYALPGFGEGFDQNWFPIHTGHNGGTEIIPPYADGFPDHSELNGPTVYLSESKEPRTYSDFIDWDPKKAPDLGVPELVDRIEQAYPGLVKHVEIPIHKVQNKGWQGPPQNLTDLDVLLENGVVIQVKTGKGKNLLKQLEISSEITGMPAIGFDANKLANSGKPDITWQLQKNVRDAGFQITNNVDELLEMIRKLAK